jgi:hypothetical protein
MQIAHEDPAMMDKFKRAYEAGKVAETFVPPPNWAEIIRKEKIEEMRKNNPASAELADRLDIDIDIEKELAADQRWYDWNVKNWGTKWDFPNTQSMEMIDKNRATASFDTAWSPPIKVFEALVEQGYSVRVLYSEEGMGFGGIWYNGVDEFYNNPEDFPEELLETFGIELLDEEEEEGKEEGKGDVK